MILFSENLKKSRIFRQRSKSKSPDSTKSKVSKAVDELIAAAASFKPNVLAKASIGQAKDTKPSDTKPDSKGSTLPSFFHQSTIKYQIICLFTCVWILLS